MMLAAITAFGAVRFGSRAMGELLPMRSVASRWRWLPLGCAGATTLWLTGHPFAPRFSLVGEGTARLLAATAAVLTADAAARKKWNEPVRQIEAGGAIALLAGLFRPTDPEWLLPSYLIVFAVRLAIHSLQRIRPSSSQCTE